MKKTPSVATQHASEAQSSSSSANGGASQVVGANDPAIHALITDLIEEVVKFGRFPKYSHSARNKEDREENCFYVRLQRKKKALPSDAWAELERIVASQLDAKHQELLAEVRNFGRLLAGASDPAITNLIAEIVNLGRFPKRHNAAQSKNDQEEDSFAQRLGRQKRVFPRMLGRNWNASLLLSLMPNTRSFWQKYAILVASRNASIIRKLMVTARQTASPNDCRH